MAQWALDTSKSEETLFNRYAVEKLNLKGDDVAKFRRLALLSADAVLRGKTTTRADVSPWWSRDQNISMPQSPPASGPHVLKETAEAVQIWEQISQLAREINFSDPITKDHVIVSSEYGLRVYRIYQALYELSAAREDNEKISHWLKVYDQAWVDYRRLPEMSSQCASLYLESGSPKGGGKEGIEKFIPRLREKVASPSGLAQPQP
jgi:hypothetical protein